MNESARKAIDMAIGYFMVERGITRGRMAELMGMSRNTLRWKGKGNMTGHGQKFSDCLS